MENESKWKKYSKKLAIPTLLFLAAFVITIHFFNFSINVLYGFYIGYFVDGTILKPNLPPISFETFNNFNTVTNNIIFIVILGLLSLLTSSYFVYKVKSNFGKLSKKQKGSSRFTTIKEIEKQYRAVPEKEEQFEGGGGVPVSRLKNKVFIDNSAVNNLWIGTTRSGKGEMGIFPTIDIYSRAKEKASMIINDPKGELYAASKETLENRGYHVEVLNLMNPFQSMSNNILEIVKQEYFAGNYSLAQQYARSISFMLYNDPKSNDKVWDQNSTNLCTAIILALCEHCKNEPKKISMFNVALMLSDLSSRTVVNDDGEEESALIEYFKRFPSHHPAKLQFASYEAAQGSTRGSILMNTATQLGIFTLDGIAKLTSDNSLDMNKVGFNHWLRGKSKPLVNLTILFPNGVSETIKTDSNGGFSLYHDHHLELGDEIIISFEFEKETISTVFTVFEMDLQTGDIEVSADNTATKLNSVMQFKKPIAIFMIVPDYDESFNVIASIYVKQLYTTLARTASTVKGRQCFREVVFLLDEFGNMPAIDGMANILSVCLGRNIRFNLFVQAYAQIEKLYGDDWKTIDGNTNNTFYILTDDYSTAEMISNKLGNKEITTKSRSGQTLSLNKTKTESVETRPLLSPDELIRLNEGEMVVIRTIKRQDKERKRIKQFPIFNTGKTVMKYRWEYLSDYFDTDTSINDIDIPCKHAALDLNKLRVRFDDSMLEEESNGVLEENMSVPETNSEVIFTNSENKSNVKKIPKSERMKIATNIKHQDLLKNVEEETASGIEEAISRNTGASVKAGLIDKKFFMLCFKDTQNFETLFGESYQEMEMTMFKDKVIAYKDEFKENTFVVLMQKINHALRQGEDIHE
jgi:type IV secretory pathway TraG/TraD family ATPase VirD4